MSDSVFATLLRKALPGAMPNGTDRWTFPVAAGAGERATVEVRPNWVSFRFEPREGFDAPRSATAALVRQAEWPGNVKIAAKAGRAALVADVPFSADAMAARSWLVFHIDEVVRGFVLATGYRSTGAAPDTPAGREFSPELMADRCRAAGFHAEILADGEIQVAIESRAVRRFVRMVRKNGNLRLRVTLDSGDLAEAGSDSLKAVAHFLLRASASLRFARAWVAGTTSSLEEVGFECTIATCDCDVPLVAAIDSLGAACDFFGQEGEALMESADLARCYLHFVDAVRHDRTQSSPKRHLPRQPAAVPWAAAAAISA